MISKKIVLKFPKKIIDEPIVYKLVKDYNLVFNILRASINLGPEEGELVLELIGDEKDCQEGINYLKKLGVTIESLEKDVTRDEERCTDCGACITICPTGAFFMDANSMKVIFEADKCIACGACVKGCPPRAMKVKL